MKLPLAALGRATGSIGKLPGRDHELVNLEIWRDAMADTAVKSGHNNAPALDTSDVDKWVGKPIVFAELWDPCNATDIRRWVQAMDYANPLHWDQEFASKTKFGDIIAPQSMAVSLDYGHGCQPACVGRIPGSHLIFGGEEWWWFGTHIKPGDKLFQERRF